jgi:hypothetical protein
LGQSVINEVQNGNLWDLKELSFPVSHLAPGVYIVTVSTGPGKETIQFVKH